MRNTKKFIVIGAGVVTLLAGGGAAAYAAAAAPTSPAAPTAPKITAERAIELAHQQVQGAWVSEVDHDDSGEWEVELVKDAQVYEVTVDAASGKVTAHGAKQADKDDDANDDANDDKGGDRDDD
ncbi:Peptidase propeptide and YPEB domain protein [Nonomuraea coxensis DSM 45129]|uniref:Peptidase propeptide and YPEB domain protein n=1 Tax=Nonomuraea coxensis DSM 45129 TaxID=1122611 RepID=A0ABX8TW62_9ACTN|nr:PepSY domain-containing protein [Nonomuraea coxensis]QYC39715.1 Peptidase propeptide and YPEB domain protein [Nonomuraea coxensis DSM 45129]